MVEMVSDNRSHMKIKDVERLECKKNVDKENGF